MFYKPKYFDLRELVSSRVWTAMGAGCLRIFDPRLLETLDLLRERWGVMYINNWMWGGHQELRGLRHLRLDYAKLNAQNIYSHFSMHNYGRAIDATFKSVSAEGVRRHIVANQRDYPAIRGIEDGVSWLHIDTRNSDRLIIFKA